MLDDDMFIDESSKEQAPADHSDTESEEECEEAEGAQQQEPPGLREVLEGMLQPLSIERLLEANRRIKVPEFVFQPPALMTAHAGQPPRAGADAQGATEPAAPPVQRPTLRSATLGEQGRPRYAEEPAELDEEEGARQREAEEAARRAKQAAQRAQVRSSILQARADAPDQWDRQTDVCPLISARGSPEAATLSRKVRSSTAHLTAVVRQAHGLTAADGAIRFFRTATIQDPDHPDHTFLFNLEEKYEGGAMHGACFYLGRGSDGAPLISASLVEGLYHLPDRTPWAMHRDLYDAEDLEAHARVVGLPCRHLLDPPLAPNELMLKQQVHHSRLSNMETECWIFKGRLPPPSKLLVDSQDAFFYKSAFDPFTMELGKPT